MIVLPDAENRTIVTSSVWIKHRNVTDRQTDRNILTIVCDLTELDARLKLANLLTVVCIIVIIRFLILNHTWYN